MLNSKILRLAGADCGIALPTSFRWRHRFLKLAERLDADHFSGIVEADQTLIRESFKGRKKGLPRLARKRGNDHKKETHWVPVLVARNRERHEADFVLNHFTLVNVKTSLMPRIPKDIVLCSDSHLTFEALATKYHLEHKVLNATDGERVKEGAYHIQNVNNYHRRLKHWLAPFLGVATKYLHRYLGWFRWFDQHSHSLRQPIDFAMDFVEPR